MRVIWIWMTAFALGMVGCPSAGLLISDDDDVAADDDDSNADDDDDTSSGDDDTSSGDDDTSPPDADGDGYPEDEDCDDADPEMYPGVTLCDDAEVLECSAAGELVAVMDCSPGACVDGQCDTLSCDGAAILDSHLGCRFYAFDMKQYVGFDENQLAVVVTNPSADYPVAVTVEDRSSGVWAESQSAEVAPLSEAILLLPDRGVEGSALLGGAAWRILSDLPLTAVQFNGLDYVYTADASLLLPHAGLDDEYVLPGHPHGDYGESTTVVIAAEDGVDVVVTPSCATAAGPGVPGGVAGVAMSPITLAEGDALQLLSVSVGHDLSGSLVTSSGPVVVLAGHPCVNVPEDQGFCDHLEEQVPGTRRWGTTAVAARLPARAEPPEIAVWQVVAGTAGTTVSFDAGADVQGLPPSDLVLGPREVAYLDVSGSSSDPGDFLAEGTEPFLLSQFLAGNAVAGEGDPCMTLTTPAEQMRESYLVYADPHLDSNHAAITRSAGTTVEVDGVDVDAWPAGVQLVELGGGWEVVRIALNPGTHAMAGSAPFGASLGGWSDYVAVCFPAGF
jgi:hypothetical protein